MSTIAFLFYYAVIVTVCMASRWSGSIIFIALKYNVNNCIFILLCRNCNSAWGFNLIWINDYCSIMLHLDLFYPVIVIVRMVSVWFDLMIIVALQYNVDSCILILLYLNCNSLYGSNMIEFTKHHCTFKEQYIMFCISISFEGRIANKGMKRCWYKGITRETRFNDRHFNCTYLSLLSVLAILDNKGYRYFRGEIDTCKRLHQLLLSVIFCLKKK